MMDALLARCREIASCHPAGATTGVGVSSGPVATAAGWSRCCLDASLSCCSSSDLHGIHVFRSDEEGLSACFGGCLVVSGCNVSAVQHVLLQASCGNASLWDPFIEEATPLEVTPSRAPSTSSSGEDFVYRVECPGRVVSTWASGGGGGGSIGALSVVIRLCLRALETDTLPVSRRMFCVSRNWKTLDTDGSFVLLERSSMGNAAAAAAVETRPWHVVMGTQQCSGWVVMPCYNDSVSCSTHGSTSSVLIVRFSSVDLSGWIPHSLANWIKCQMVAHRLAGLRAYLAAESSRVVAAVAAREHGGESLRVLPSSTHLLPSGSLEYRRKDILAAQRRAHTALSKLFWSKPSPNQSCDEDSQINTPSHHSAAASIDLLHAPSLPKELLSRRTVLEHAIDPFQFLPQLMHKACAAFGPIERFKYTIAAFVAGLHTDTDQQLPRVVEEGSSLKGKISCRRSNAARLPTFGGKINTADLSKESGTDVVDSAPSVAFHVRCVHENPLLVGFRFQSRNSSASSLSAAAASLPLSSAHSNSKIGRRVQNTKSGVYNSNSSTDGCNNSNGEDGDSNTNDNSDSQPTVLSSHHRTCGFRMKGKWRYDFSLHSNGSATFRRSGSCVVHFEDRDDPSDRALDHRIQITSLPQTGPALVGDWSSDKMPASSVESRPIYWKGQLTFADSENLLFGEVQLVGPGSELAGRLLYDGRLVSNIHGSWTSGLYFNKWACWRLGESHPSAIDVRKK